MAIRICPARPLRALAFGLLAVALFAGGALAAAAFNDVGDDHPASAEITAAHSIGVFNGYGDGTFRPDGKLTQGQAENVIWRILSWQGTDDDGKFRDKPSRCRRARHDRIVRARVRPDTRLRRRSSGR